MANLAHKLKEVERHYYLAGLIQGREDAVAGRKSRLRSLWDSDTALRLGYVQGFNGMRVALRNERSK